jgi:hypothetical protein
MIKPEMTISDAGVEVAGRTQSTPITITLRGAWLTGGHLSFARAALTAPHIKAASDAWAGQG